MERIQLTNTVAAVRAIIATAEAMRNAYFFTPPCSAGARRAYERQHSHDVVMWQDGRHTYSAAYECICSCRNVYARGLYTKDGRPTTLAAIKNSMNRLYVKVMKEAE